MTKRGAPYAVGGELIFDWNRAGKRYEPPGAVEFFDETLRDGIQDPSAKDPTLEDKLELLHLMNGLGIQAVDVGLPGSSERAFNDVLRICNEVASQKLSLKVACAGRTAVEDVAPMVEISQRSGVPIEVYTFIGSSSIRTLTEDWSLDFLLKRSAKAIDLGHKNGLEVAYVTEDTTRSRPEVLAALFKNAIDHGATRLCLCDTVGHATPDGVRNLVAFAKNVVAASGARHVKIDWHGHNDRGLGLVNALYAIECGADRVHATALGVGERVGNTPMELLFWNLKLLGALPGRDLSSLLQYCQTAARALGLPMPVSYPWLNREEQDTSAAMCMPTGASVRTKAESLLENRDEDDLGSIQYRPRTRIRKRVVSRIGAY